MDTKDKDAIPSLVPREHCSVSQQELKKLISYMDQVLAFLPENKIEEFVQSEYFDTYHKLFDELGLKYEAS